MPSIADSTFLSILLAILGSLLTIVGFFLMGLLRKFEKNNEILATFCTRLEVIMEKIKTIQEDTIRGDASLQKSVDRNERDIELLRKRMHFIINHLTAIKLKLEMSGIKVDNLADWDEERNSLGD